MDPSTYIRSPKLNRCPSRPRKGQKTAIFDTETGLQGPLLTFFGLLCIPILRGWGLKNVFFSFLHLCQRQALANGFTNWWGGEPGPVYPLYEKSYKTKVSRNEPKSIAMDPSTYIWSPKLNRGPSRPRKGQKTAIFDTETGLEGPLLTFFGFLCIPILRGCGWENAFFSFLHLCHASRARGDAWKMRVLFSEPRKLTIGLAVWEALDGLKNPLAGPNWSTLMGTWALFSLRPIRVVD